MARHLARQQEGGSADQVRSLLSQSSECKVHSIDILHIDPPSIRVVRNVTSANGIFTRKGTGTPVNAFAGLDDCRIESPFISVEGERRSSTSKTIQDMLRWADPSILLKVYAHSRMEAQAKMIEAMGLNEKTAQRFMQ
jgi:hypothetical protein